MGRDQNGSRAVYKREGVAFLPAYTCSSRRRWCDNCSSWNLLRRGATVDDADVPWWEGGVLLPFSAGVKTVFDVTWWRRALLPSPILPGAGIGLLNVYWRTY